MKKYLCLLIVLVIAMTTADVSSAPPIFKQKKYYGPIPLNTISLSIGFIDGPDAEYLTNHLDEWAFQRNGYDIFESIATSPYLRIGYERQLTPNHFFRTSIGFAYLKTESIGFYVAQVPQADTTALIPLEINRTFKVYLFSLEAGFAYYFISPEVRRFSPYVGAGFAAVFPLARLNTDSYNEGHLFSNPGENISRNSFEAGMHTEFGMIYYITNRYSAGIEGRYQMSQSKFYIHNGNFDINYAGFTLTLNLYHHF